MSTATATLKFAYGISPSSVLAGTLEANRFSDVLLGLLVTIVYGVVFAPLAFFALPPLSKALRRLGTKLALVWLAAGLGLMAIDALMTRLLRG
jgi:hypothetical protein